MKKIIVLNLLLITLFVCLKGEIKFRGDARVRPRLDQRFDQNGKTYQDFYYLYWVRLWMDAELEDGWYFTTKLAADGPSSFISKFGGPTYDGIKSWTGENAVHSGHRGAIRFNEAHFGRKTSRFGFSMGILPFNALAEPEFDLHFYPVSKSDIPYLILNNNSAAGFRGYYKLGPGKLRATVTVDNNTGNREEVDLRDQYSSFLNYDFKLGEFKLRPSFIASLGAENRASPLTAGLNVETPQYFGFNFQAGGYFTSQQADIADPASNSGYLGLDDFSAQDSANYTGKYSGPGFHVQLSRKIGPGSFVGWVDHKIIDMDGVNDSKNTTYIWLKYNYPVYKSKSGSFWVGPTFRQIRQTFGGIEYIRNKIEVTLHFNFK